MPKIKLVKLTEDLKKNLSNFYDNKKNVDSNIKISELKKYFLERFNKQLEFEVYPEEILKDKDLGLWDLFTVEEIEESIEIKESENEEGWEARDPNSNDILKNTVAIDFGTSSTVVAFRNKAGRKVLIRIGNTSGENAFSSEVYENPSMVQFFNIEGIKECFSSTYSRPFTRWGDAPISHTVKKNLQDNIEDNAVINQIISDLKTFVKENDAKPLRLVDDKEKEFEIKWQHNNDINKLSGSDEFDPIEYYAYLIGLYVNNQNYKTSTEQYVVFTKYQLTVPVNFSKESKERLRRSFTRGLRRSIPKSLLDRGIDIQVEIKHYEPVAYAAGVIINKKLDERDVNFAVYDLGAGTADFSYGHFGEAKDDNYDFQLTLYRISGNNYLGAESIFNEIAYYTYIDDRNFEKLLNERIPFYIPLQIGTPRPGCELIRDNSCYGRTNTYLLVNKIRKYIVGGFKKDSEGGKPKINFNIIPDKKSEKTKNIEITLDYSFTNEHFTKKIYEGIRQFFMDLSKAFSGKEEVKKIDIFLAGNASKSIVVKKLFDLVVQYINGKYEEYKADDSGDENKNIEEVIKEFFAKEDKTFLDDLKGKYEFEIHQPSEDKKNEEDKENKEDKKNKDYPFTCKTGVALGLVELIGGKIKFEDKRPATFNYYLGRYKKRKFEVIIKRDAEINWYDFGMFSPDTNEYTLVFTKNTEVENKEFREGETDIFREEIIQFDDTEGKTLYVKVINPDEIICTAQNSVEDIPKEFKEKEISKEVLEKVKKGEYPDFQIVKLKY